MSTTNSNFYNALLCQPVNRIPVWLLRQAGRYLPEYLALRQKSKDFLSFCKNPSLAAEATLQPLTRFGFDASIIFSDILTIPDAMGAQVEFVENEGPRINHPIRTAADIAQLRIPDPQKDLSYVLEAIERVKAQIDVPLIGFCGSPWTLACYMIEGMSTPHFAASKKCLYQTPELLENLLTLISESVALHLSAQIAAGVDVVMLFDTWGGILTSADYDRYSLAFMQKVFAKIPREKAGKIIPRIMFTKGGGMWLPKMAKSGCDAIAIDWTVDLSEARSRVGNHIALQGNIDPLLLQQGTPDSVRQHVRALLDQNQQNPGFILNAGHGVLPKTPIENVEAFVKTAREYPLHG